MIVLSSVIKPPPQSQHQMVRVVEVLQLISRMQIEVAGERSLEGKYLIPSFRVGPLVQEVVPDAEVDGEDEIKNLQS